MLERCTRWFILVNRQVAIASCSDLKWLMRGEWHCMESRGAQGVTPLIWSSPIRNLPRRYAMALCFGSSHSRFVQNLRGSTRVSYAEDQQGLIRAWFDPCVGIVNVDVCFPELGSRAR